MCKTLWVISACLFPDTDLTLTTERLVELFASVDDEKISLLKKQLDIPISKEEEIKVNYKSPIKQKEAYLDYYVHSNPFGSWVKIARTLRRLRLSQQADVVENTYIKGMHLLSWWLCNIH